MLLVQDGKRSLCFYGDVLGLDSRGDTPEWARLTLGDDFIVLRENSYDSSDDTLTGTAVRLVREGGVRELTWTGPYLEIYDIPKGCRRVEEGGGGILSPSRRAREGTIVADIADPEGNVLIS